MSSSLNLFLRRLRDPRWIPHISSYCDGRCERCAFTERCWSYALRQHEAGAPELDTPLEDETDANGGNDRTARVQSWAERHDIDLNDVTMSASETRAYEQLQERIHNDPLGKRAREYGNDIHRVMESLVPAERGGGFGRAAPGSELSNAVEDIWSLAFTIGVKTHRAISSLEHNKEEDFEMDSVQTDANGSAKVARVAIAQSLAAWKIVEPAGLIDPGLAKYLRGNLERIESELSERFPLAMGFVRPGFDEEIPGIVRPWSIMPDEDDEEEGTDD
jgi:hypothetical protein